MTPLSIPMPIAARMSRRMSLPSLSNAEIDAADSLKAPEAEGGRRA
jgi:hypothetical protein